MELRNPGAVIEETIRTSMLKKIFQQMPISDVLLDIGCGPRPYYSIYFNRFNKTFGIEHPDAPFPKDKIDIYCLAEEIPLPNEYADAILSTEMLHDMPQPSNVLKEFNRLLKPGGKLIMTTPFMVPIVDGVFDHYRYTRQGLSYLLENSGFEIIEIKPVSDMFGVAVTILIKPWLRLWNTLAKVCGMKWLYSGWNPLFLITVLFPQAIHLFLSELPLLNKLYRRFNYGSIGYLTLAVKK